MNKERNYMRLMNEFINIPTPLEIKILDTIRFNNENYPVFCFRIHSKAKHNVVINSGCHGNESVGTKVILRFLTEFDKELLCDYNFWIFPVISPIGYTYDRRTNGQKLDPNRHCYLQNSPVEVPEFKIFDEEVPNKIDLFVDIHQSLKKGYYAYEKKRKTDKSLAEYGLNAIKMQGFKIEVSESIYGEKCINGVVDSGEDKINSFEDYAYRKGAKYSITFENNGSNNDEDHIVASLIFIKTVLNKFKELK